MGLFDRLFGRNKQNQLPAGQDYSEEEQKYKKIQDRINSMGNTIEVYFDPSKWQQMSENDKSESIVAYPIEEENISGEKNSIVLVNLLTKNPEGKNIEINLLRYVKSENVEHNLKNVTELIKNVINSQNNDEISKMEKVRYISKLRDLINVNDGKVSKEGVAILKNDSARTINMNRTVFVERDEEGYIYDYQEKDDIGLVNKLIETIHDERKLVKRRETIDIETEVLDERAYESLDDKRDLLMGVINLCRLANNLHIGAPVDTIGKEDASTTFDKLRKTSIAPGETDQLKMISNLKKHTVDVCIKLESLIERFNYDKDFIVFSEEEDEKVRKLLDTVLRFSKKEFKKQVENEHEKSEKEQVSYYRQMVDRLNNTINELQELNMALKQENAELTQENAVLLEEVEQLKEERFDTIKFIKKNMAGSTNEELVKLLSKFDKFAYEKSVLGAISSLKENAKNKEIETVVEEKEQEEKEK